MDLFPPIRTPAQPVDYSSLRPGALPVPATRRRSDFAVDGWHRRRQPATESSASAVLLGSLPPRPEPTGGTGLLHQPEIGLTADGEWPEPTEDAPFGF